MKIDAFEGGYNGLGHAMQIFDVSDPAAPALTQQFVFEGSGNQANANPGAMTFHPDRNLVVFPASISSQYSNALEVFRVDVETGFEQLGSISKHIPDEECFALLGNDPSSLDGNQDRDSILSDWRGECTGFAYHKRGVFRGNTLYAISNVDVTVHDLADLSTPLATIMLPPEYGHFMGSMD
jgi:hypothetical protein